jgi:cytochrome c peroxidase
LIKFIYPILLSLSILFCDKKEGLPTSGTSYTLQHDGLPQSILPGDNPVTSAGIALGRHLFYDPILSSDKSISCANCHDQKNAFSNTNRFSIGVRGLPGKRQALAVFNMAWNTSQFFWDGRVDLLRHQSLMPIEDELEMDETLERVIIKLKAESNYVLLFNKAFPKAKIDVHHISLALEQFMFTIVSNQSKYDRYLKGTAFLTPSEERGHYLFFTGFNAQQPLNSGANCTMCHGGSNFENDEYMNNGLDTELYIKDLGRGNVTGVTLHNGRFKVPSLRNIELTYPYMHDGRFRTLKKVGEHYNENIHFSASLNPTLSSIQNNGGLKLTAQDQQDLIQLLKILTDNQLIKNNDYSTPF